MFLNISGKTQVLHNVYRDYTSINNKEIISEYVYPIVQSIPTQFKKIDKINLEGVNSILLKRSHSLGDIIMTFPIVNYLQDLGKKVYVYTNTRYSIPGVEFVLSTQLHSQDYDLIINLDHVVERDHFEEAYYQLNRVDIYAEYLNLKNIGNNWKVKFEDKEVDTEDAIIAIQLKGSTPAKRLNLAPILNELEKRNIKFYVIDDITEYKTFYKNAVVKQTDVLGLMNMLLKIKGVLTFDSGPLWLSHVTNTPAFVIVGPTCGKKITGRHPNSKTTYYDTKADYNCSFKMTGCGESCKDCKGQFSCLKNVNHEKLKNSFFTWMEGL